MRFVANSRIAAGTTMEPLTEFFGESGFSSSGWDLVRHRVVTEYALEVGDTLGSCCSSRPRHQTRLPTS